MKKIAFFFAILLTVFTFALAEDAPTVIVDAPAQNIPDSVIADIVAAHPDAESIHIYAYGQTDHSATANNAVAPQGLFTYSYSNITKHCAQHHGRFRTDFIISVARGSETTLSTEYSTTVGVGVSGSVTSGTDSSAPMPTSGTLGLNTSCSVTCKISTSRTFRGPSDDSEYNSRSFYVAYYGDIGGWSCTATRSIPASTVQMSGRYVEPTEYAEYSVDNKITHK